MVRVVAVHRQDLLGCLKERIGGQSVSLRERWQDLLAGSDNFMEKPDICSWVRASAICSPPDRSCGREELTFVGVVRFVVVLAAADV